MGGLQRCTRRVAGRRLRKNRACIWIPGAQHLVGDVVMRDPGGPWLYENIEAVNIAVTEDGSFRIRIDRKRDCKTLVAMLGALGGESRSEAKAAASRANGARGGRPRKHFQPGRA